MELQSFEKVCHLPDFEIGPRDLLPLTRPNIESPPKNRCLFRQFFLARFHFSS